MTKNKAWRFLVVVSPAVALVLSVFLGKLLLIHFFPAITVRYFPHRGTKIQAVVAAAKSGDYFPLSISSDFIFTGRYEDEISEVLSFVDQWDGPKNVGIAYLMAAEITLGCSRRSEEEPIRRARPEVLRRVLSNIRTNESARQAVSLESMFYFVGSLMSRRRDEPAASAEEWSIVKGIITSLETTNVPREGMWNYYTIKKLVEKPELSSEKSTSPRQPKLEDLE